MSIKLSRSPIPSGDSEKEIGRDPILCSICWNLYAGSINTAPFSTSRMSLRDAVANAEPGKPLGKAPGWARGDARLDYASWKFSVALAKMPDSADSGCDTCRLLYVAIQRLSGGSVDFSDHHLRLEVTMCRGNALQLVLWKDAAVTDEYEEAFGFDVFADMEPAEDVGSTLEATWELYTLPNATCPWSSIGNRLNKEEYHDSDKRLIRGGARQVPSDAHSDTTFDRIKAWISTCKKEHSICAQVDALSTSRLPKRVLHLGGPGSGFDDDDVVHLVERTDKQHCEDEPYIALSHCWGETQHLTSTRESLDQRKKGIPMSSMSRTFQDAVVISRKLGIRHLWIDSLCIIQDDSHDWEVEAANMASIYNGAYLVVAASAMPDGSGGCLFDRPPETIIDGTSASGEAFRIYGRRPIDHDVFEGDTAHNDYRHLAPINTDSRFRKVKLDFPLMTRAWCLQERMLATRILHYTKAEVVFQCSLASNCECGALEDYDRDSRLSARRSLLKRPNRAAATTRGLTAATGTGGGDGHGVDDFDTWHDIVMDFSEKQITKRTDCLPAMAGLAVKWHDPASMGRYLAGIWEKDLLRSLMWRANSADSDGKELPYIGPTWSWLGAQRAVTWGPRRKRDPEYFIEIDLGRTACHPLHTVNPYGQVRSGYISLTGRIMPVEMARNEDDDEVKFYESLGGVVLRKHGNTSSCQAQVTEADSMFRIRQHQNSSDYYCLRFFHQKPMATDKDAALVLARATPDDAARQPEHVRSSGHVYVRLGITKGYPTHEWNHEADSKEVQLYLI
ncbi:Heterokaryon incompatibility protein (HET) [Geosmithia morbida]|uniref:Heterokaryon incompatibility protein (HET) n=1 Tax=Geosmithia morbida TaxID=1094350 RepID=A0A9P5D0B2_9HYPO|nr:Heterokaryon incompatibility protein (HET) [Geosmithia morbida]KAF4122553.1 Heterokaryon incompatibility protein (HET) [Geosmithia morbida]